MKKYKIFFCAGAPRDIIYSEGYPWVKRLRNIAIKTLALTIINVDNTVFFYTIVLS